MGKLSNNKIGSNERQNPKTTDIAYKTTEDEYRDRIQIVKSERQDKKTPEEEIKNEVEDREKKEQAKIKIVKDQETKQEKFTQLELKEMLKRQQEREEQQRKKEQDWVEFNLSREHSTDETLAMYLRRVTREKIVKAGRLKTGNHTYKYVLINHKGEDIGDKILTPKIAGTDPRMKIWVLNNDGALEKREVDSIMLLQNGRYGFATDRGNGALGDITKSYLVTRLPGGEYIAVQALEQQKRNREASNIDAVKEMAASKKSDHEMKEEIKAAETSKKIEAVQEDKVTDIREVEIVKLLKDEGFKDNEINQIFKTVYEGIVKEGMTYGQAETTVSFVKGLKEQGLDMKRINQVLKQHQLKRDYRNNGKGEEDLVPGGRSSRDPRRFA